MSFGVWVTREGEDEYLLCNAGSLDTGMKIGDHMWNHRVRDGIESIRVAHDPEDGYPVLRWPKEEEETVPKASSHSYTIIGVNADGSIIEHVTMADWSRVEGNARYLLEASTHDYDAVRVYDNQEDKIVLSLMATDAIKAKREAQRELDRLDVALSKASRDARDLLDDEKYRSAVPALRAVSLAALRLARYISQNVKE